jgi:dipeptidyl aminopeptidase/acylaminoacyl peptidase
MKRSRNIVSASFTALALLGTSVAPATRQASGRTPPITIEDLVTYTRLREVSLSPDGLWVTYLTVEPRLAENRYRAKLVLQRTNVVDSRPVDLVAVDVGAADVFDRDTGAIRRFGAQALWSLDGRRLAFTGNVGGTVELRVRDVDDGREQKIGDFRGVDLIEWRDDDQVIKFSETLAPADARSAGARRDPAVRVTDDDSFWAPQWFQKRVVPPVTRTLEHNTKTHVTTEAKSAEPTDLPLGRRRTYAERGWPMSAHEEKSARFPPVVRNNLEAFVGFGTYHKDDAAKAYRDYFVGLKTVGDSGAPKEYLHGSDYIEGLSWSGDGKVLYGVQQTPEQSVVFALSVNDGATRELLRVEGDLVWAGVSWAKDGRSFVGVRRTPFMPDELLRVDVARKTISVIAAPNAAFAGKAHPSVRFMRVNNPLGGGIFGRLVLPNGYEPGKRYPLVFTTYRAGAGFLEGAVGDEFPILPYAAHGFVVFAMDTGISNMLSASGVGDFTLMRERRPVDAMETVRRTLAAEGIIHPEGCGITGLSYGSDITAYAIATTRMFKAASASLMALDPIGYTLNPVSRERTLEGFGLRYPDEDGLKEWKKRSPALNAATITTPLLLQSSDTEALLSIESFKALRRHNVPIDWYVYPDEGHLKFQPVNKYFVYQRNLDWMRFWLKGEEDPEPSKADQYARWRAMRDTFEQRLKRPGR